MRNSCRQLNGRDLVFWTCSRYQVSRRSNVAQGAQESTAEPKALPCLSAHQGNRRVAKRRSSRTPAAVLRLIAVLYPCSYPPRSMHINMLHHQQQRVCIHSSPSDAMRQRIHSAVRLRPHGVSEPLWPCCTPPARSRGTACRGVATVVAATAVSPAEAVPAVKRARRTAAFPFVRLAGQEEMKLALLLNVIDPSIGGVLIMGDRGTGKSVAVRPATQPAAPPLLWLGYYTARHGCAWPALGCVPWQPTASASYAVCCLRACQISVAAR